tara:strand:- start:2999 stop:3634 length:636 start_codon:yes stop_codon:yes gene_type:complete
MLQTLKNKAFTIIELLIVIVIIIIIAVIAYPQISNYLTDREVKKEVYALVDYIKKKKAETVSGQYAMTRIWISDKPASGKSKDWQMSNEEWNRQMANGKLSKRMCPNPKSQYTNRNSSDTFEWSSKVTSSRKHLCIDRDGIISTDMEDQNGIAGKVWMIVCSASNTGPGYSKLCYWNRDKLPHRYIIKVNPGTKLQVYKYNLGSDKWILQK